eukprot:6203102-Pleurochrysis_carterae.AAC.5
MHWDFCTALVDEVAYEVVLGLGQESRTARRYAELRCLAHYDVQLHVFSIEQASHPVLVEKTTGLVAAKDTKLRKQHGAKFASESLKFNSERLSSAHNHVYRS